MIKIHYISKKNIPNIKPFAACIGNFDASHKGHQSIYKKTISLAKKNHLKAYLITFDKDPNTVLFNEKPLFSFKTRIKLYETFGFDGIIIIKTNKKFYNMKPCDFINDYLLKLNIEYLVTGFDFKFGINQSGNNELLKKSIKHLYIIKSINYKKEKISTKRIKKLLMDNDFNDIDKMLGYEFKKY